MRILIVEDEKNLADVTAAKLKKENFTTDVCYDGDEGLYNAMTGIYDLIILDVMLPGKNGFEILREIRKAKIASKVIMLTARSMLEDKLNRLEHGANDYLTKPFHMDELMARVSIQLRDPSEYKTAAVWSTGTCSSIRRSRSSDAKRQAMRKRYSSVFIVQMNRGTGAKAGSALALR